MRSLTLLLPPSSSFFFSGEDAHNPRWCQNPQYLIQLPREPRFRPTIKLSLTRSRTGKAKRGDDANDAGQGVGLTLTKVPRKTMDNPRRRKPGTERVNALGEKLPSLRSSLAGPGSGPGGPGAADERDAKAAGTARRLQVRADEWATFSTFCNQENGTATLDKVPPDWCEDGIIVVPSTNQPGIVANFSLKILSDQPLHVRELVNLRERTPV